MSKDAKVQSPSGATSSGKRPAFHLIPTSALIRLGERYDLGAEKHGDINYRKSVSVDKIKYNKTEYEVLKLDLVFARRRYNHIITHLTNLRDSGNHYDDNIGAALWGLSYLSWLEVECGIPLEYVINPMFNNEVWLFIHKGTNQIWKETKDGQLIKDARD